MTQSQKFTSNGCVEGAPKQAVNRCGASIRTSPARPMRLIALAIAIAIRCEDCIAYHVHDALQAGATRQEILETIGVAVMMGGGPASMYGCSTYEALGQFETLFKPA